MFQKYLSKAKNTTTVDLYVADVSQRTLKKHTVPVQHHSDKYDDEESFHVSIGLQKARELLGATEHERISGAPVDIKFVRIRPPRNRQPGLQAIVLAFERIPEIRGVSIRQGSGRTTYVGNVIFEAYQEVSCDGAGEVRLLEDILEVPEITFVKARVAKVQRDEQASMELRKMEALMRMGTMKEDTSVTFLNHDEGKPLCVCGKEGPLRCGRCRIVHYCSKECQSSDWKYHRLACCKG